MLKEKIIRGLNTAWIEKRGSANAKTITVLIHGFPDSPSIWSPLLQCFDEKDWVIAPYLRGVSPSEKGDASRFGPTAIAQDLLAILKEVDPAHEKRVIVVCHDIGADPGWELARILKSSLHALVMLNGFSSDHFLSRLMNPSQAMKSWYMGYFQLPLPPRALLGGPLKRVFGKALREANYPLSQMDWEHSLELMECYRQSAKFAAGSLLNKKPPIEAPLYVLWGRNDRLLNIPKLNDFQGRCPESHLKVFDAGHWLQYEIPEVIHAELLKIEAEAKP